MVYHTTTETHTHQHHCSYFYSFVPPGTYLHGPAFKGCATRTWPVRFHRNFPQSDTFFLTTVVSQIYMHTCLTSSGCVWWVVACVSSSLLCCGFFKNKKTPSPIPRDIPLVSFGELCHTNKKDIYYLMRLVSTAPLMWLVWMTSWRVCIFGKVSRF